MSVDSRNTWNSLGEQAAAAFNCAMRLCHPVCTQWVQKSSVFACLQGGDTSNFGLQGDGGLHVQYPTLLGNLHVWLGVQSHAEEWWH